MHGRRVPACPAVARGIQHPQGYQSLQRALRLGTAPRSGCVRNPFHIRGPDTWLSVPYHYWLCHFLPHTTGVGGFPVIPNPVSESVCVCVCVCACLGGYLLHCRMLTQFYKNL